MMYGLVLQVIYKMKRTNVIDFLTTVEWKYFLHTKYGITELNGNDLVLFSDLDEIPRGLSVYFLKHCDYLLDYSELKSDNTMIVEYKQLNLNYTQCGGADFKSEFNSNLNRDDSDTYSYNGRSYYQNEETYIEYKIKKTRK